MYILGQFTLALPRLDQLHEMADATGDRLLRVQTDNILGRLLVIRGELSRGSELLERALAASEPNGDPIWTPTPLESIASIGLAAAAHAFCGRFNTAVETMSRAQRLPSAPMDAAVRAASAFYNELIAHTRGEWTTAETFAAEAIASARQADNLVYEYVAHIYLGPAVARQRRVAEGLNIQRNAVTLAERAHTQVILGRAYAYLAEILLLAGQLDEAGEYAQRGETRAQQHGHLLEAAICARIRGEIDTARSDFNAASEFLERAGATLSELEAWPEWARNQVALARLGAARGDVEVARALLASAERHFQQMDMRWDIDQVRTLRAAL
jgi:tetratricopeptide (TPR) repeat protein